ncbi:RNA polymerase sigma factor [Pedobacter frigoris]|uniref:Sigma-70 family RNA polymerase sigma factor n=1 Tax=Pedobacter frigoris TaxID=2571272 RepID=A0A4U1CLH1_9SPHI|nr:sigma-70 family RNA polymerase sigma factor [Pedobacter frigoris]TKC06299.1 sigma-70 family RNA polymerase sigma factor [Pedobacter frigoris]
MDEHEFLMLLQVHQGIIHKVCRLYREGREDQEDLFQEITYQLWKAWPTFRGAAKITTWMYRVALNTAIASFRKKKPAVEYQPVLPDLPQEDQNEEQMERQEKLFRVLKQLDDSEKAIITLYFEELSYKQIAEVTGISENNVGVRLNRIKNKIQKLLIR